MIAAYQARCQAQVDAALEHLFNAPSSELTRLYAAMRYSVMNGGKRVRPLLAYAACEALGGKAEQANGAACAVDQLLALFDGEGHGFSLRWLRNGCSDMLIATG